jgi:LETM1 and EF-hand domain-containing protein 1
MRAYGLSEDALRTQLAQWLDLSLEKKVPPSLLLLSRALLLPDRIPTSDQLKATISVLPDTVVSWSIICCH